MEEVSTLRITWATFWLVAFALVLIHFVLLLFKQLLPSSSKSDKFVPILNSGLYKIKVLGEPIAVIILMMAFISINPIYHAPLVLILLLFSFIHLKNYFSGRVVLLDDGILEREEIKIGEYYGTIAKLGRLGLKLRTEDGLRHINYSQVLVWGYTNISRKEIGEFYRLLIVPKENETSINHERTLSNLLGTSPYVYWKRIPEIIKLREEKFQIEARLFVREPRHLDYLMGAIEEWGYSCKLNQISR